MMTGAWTAAKHERIKLRRMNGYGSKGLVASKTILAPIHTKMTAPKLIRNFQLPPNSAMRSERRSPKVSFFSNCFSISLETISCWRRLSTTSSSSAESSPISSCSTSLTYSLRQSPMSSKQTNPVPSHSGWRSEEHTSELQSRFDLVCRLLLEKKNHVVDALLCLVLDHIEQIVGGELLELLVPLSIGAALHRLIDRVRFNRKRRCGNDRAKDPV